MADFPSTSSAYGRWGLMDVRDAIMGGNWPSPPLLYDPYFNYVSLLLHGDGMPGVLPFNSDASTNNFNIAINGDTKPNPFNPYQPGYYGNYFDGTGDYLSIGANTAFALGTGDFTVECWINSTVLTSDTYYRRIYMTDGPTGNASGNFQIAIAPSTGYVNAWDGGTLDLLGTSNVCNGQWNHIAVTRSGTTLRIFVNGTQQASTTYSVSISPNSGSPRPYIGTYDGTNGDFSGYISNLRVVKGTAVYTSNFTPSTTPLTAITNTSLLTCQSNRFIDNSTNNFTITRNGDVAVSYLQPFTVPSTYEDYGAGYFDGTGDYLAASATTIDNFGTGDFTVEAWIYVTTIGTNNPIVVDQTTGQFAFGIAPTNYLYYGTSDTADILTSSTISDLKSCWHHVAISRTSGTASLYLDGVRVATGSNSTNFSSGGLWAGRRASGAAFNGYISDVRVVKGTGVYSGATITVPTSPLTAITNTQLLTLQTNGGANNSGFVDSSPNDFVITRNGNATQGSFSPYGDNWSNYFDGASYLQLADSTAWDLSADYTIEMWLFVTSTPNSPTFFQIGSSSLLWYLSSSTKYLTTTGGLSMTASTALNLNTWNHVALSRSGSSTNNTKMYLNGVKVAETTNNTSFTGDASNGLRIGAEYTSGFYLNGYISNLRLVKGTAVYTGDSFTVPTAPLTAITNTQLLTCQSNRFKDSSANNFTITRNGNTSVQRFNPFGAPDTYSAATIGGSGYFDGTGDYLSVANNAAFELASVNFTLETWVYFNSFTSTNGNVLISKGASGSVGGDFFSIQANSSGVIQFFFGSGSPLLSGSTLVNSTWYHIAVTRSGTTFTLWVNGISSATATSSTTLSSGGPCIVGSQSYSPGASDRSLYGYLSDTQIVKGTALYTGSFTPPTAPLTPVTNTSLLLSMTNAGIYDNAMMADLETVGNAQVSTSVKKYGTGSMAFDGTGDYLKTPYTSLFSFGTGDFTVECWANISSVQYTAIISSTNTAITTAMWLLGFSNTTNQMTFGIDSGGGAICGADYTSYLNTWTHIAASRSGSTLKLFFNGVQVNSVSNSTSFTGDTANSVVFGRRYTNSDQYHLNGYIDDLRITKGVARYTANFTPPTEAFQNYGPV